MNKKRILKDLRKVLGKENVLSHIEDVIVFEQDAFIMRALPDFVVFPTSTEQVQRIAALASAAHVPIVPRGAGTGVSGGAVPITGGIMTSFSKMNRILEIDVKNRCAVVEPGVINIDISRAAKPYGYFYAPDPSSQMVCTIGGNIAENSGGIHGVAYGVTTNHVLGLEVVLPSGEVVELGGKTLDCPGYDLVGAVVGSEGTLGIVTKITLRLLHMREAFATMVVIFNSLEDASQTVADIMARGIMPSSLELMDNMAIRAVEEAYRYGYPMDADAVLLIELEGVREAMERPFNLIKDIALKNSAREIRTASTQEEREYLWKGRKGVFGAVGMIAPNQFTQDGVVPRPKLPEVLRKVVKIGEKYSLKIANVAHAGDGNLHPLIMFDPRKPGELEKVTQAGEEILRLCVEAGGTITGEHGVGIEKREFLKWLFTDVDLGAMRAVKDIFDPKGILNPGKVFETDIDPKELRVSSIGAAGGGGSGDAWV
ncbi:MAG: FAD-linked oxidase C-terminal domain-containing protein [Thermodesulfobacteriota bacterium]